MQSKNASNSPDRCYDSECMYSLRAHKHVRTNDGEYIKYIIDRPVYKESEDAYTSR